MLWAVFKEDYVRFFYFKWKQASNGFNYYLSTCCSGGKLPANSLLTAGFIIHSLNLILLLTKYEGCTGYNFPEVMAVWAKPCEVYTKAAEGQYSPVALEKTKLVVWYLVGIACQLISKIKNTWLMTGDGAYGKILTSKELIRLLAFTYNYIAI